MVLEAVLLDVEVTDRDLAIHLREFVGKANDALLVVAARANATRVVARDVPPGLDESLEPVVAGLHVIDVTATLERQLAFVVTRQARHVPVVHQVDDDVRLLLGDVVAGPLEVIRVHARLDLRVRDHDVHLADALACVDARRVLAYGRLQAAQSRLDRALVDRALRRRGLQLLLAQRLEGHAAGSVQLHPIQRLLYDYVEQLRCGHGSGSFALVLANGQDLLVHPAVQPVIDDQQGGPRGAMNRGNLLLGDGRGVLVDLAQVIDDVRDLVPHDFEQIQPGQRFVDVDARRVIEIGQSAVTLE